MFVHALTRELLRERQRERERENVRIKSSVVAKSRVKGLKN